MQYAPVGAGAGSAGTPAQVSWPSAGGAGPSTSPSPASAGGAGRPAQAFVPASFDSEGFERVAKMIFIRMQAANDAADVNDLRNFTTPEMFASAQLDLLERGTKAQRTEVLNVQTQVLDVAEEGSSQVVSVRFQGQVREEAGSAPVDFNEIWHLVKPSDDSRSWAIAGIEQSH
jgi:predicted lipid-binding transport protein (Tim44 family)